MRRFRWNLLQSSNEEIS